MIFFTRCPCKVIGHADRVGPLRDHCTGLMASTGRKSVEPMAAITTPQRTPAQHQSLLHFVGQGAWSDAAVLAKVRERVVPRIERYGAIKTWIVDDTSFPKKGEHSVGVAHQQRGQLGPCSSKPDTSESDHTLTEGLINAMDLDIEQVSLRLRVRSLAEAIKPLERTPSPSRQRRPI